MRWVNTTRVRGDADEPRTQRGLIGVSVSHRDNQGEPRRHIAGRTKGSPDEASQDQLEASARSVWWHARDVGVHGRTARRSDPTRRHVHPGSVVTDLTPAGFDPNTPNRPYRPGFDPAT